MRSSGNIGTIRPPADWPEDRFPRSNLAVLGQIARLHGAPPGRLLLKIFPYRSTLCRLARRGGVYRLGVHPLLAGAPADVFGAAVRCLFARLAGRQADPADRVCMREFAARLEAAEDFRPPPPRRKPPCARGRFIDLAPICRRVNHEYFGGQVAVAGVGWTARAAIRKMAHFHPSSGTIWINRRLDDPAVPAFVLEYLLYHEMLHALLPPERRSGRQVYHHRRFRELERAFPHRDRALRFLERLPRHRRRH